MSSVGLSVKLAAQVGSLHIDVDLDTGPSVLVVVGPNGAGKSSLLDLVLGLRSAATGRVTVSGEVLLDREAGIDVPIEHRRIGYVPQDYALFPHLSVRDNLVFAVASASGGLNPVQQTDRVNAMLRELGLDTHAHRRPNTLSGGEKQRVALARALAVSPRALLLDEPLAALDVHSRREVRSFLAGHLRRLGLPTIVVTHDADDARTLGDRIAVLENGRLSQVGTWAELAERPASAFIEELAKEFE